MKLKATLETLEGLDEAFHSLYEEVGEEFVLTGIEDKDYKSKIAEFRDNNITFKNQLAEATAAAEKFKDVDPEKYTEMKATLEEMKDKELLDSGQLEELIAKRTERMRQEYSDKFTKLEQRATEAEAGSENYKNQLNVISINEAVTKAVLSSANVRVGALPDILSRAKTTWTIGEKGALEARDTGGNVLYDNEGKGPLQMKEWADTLIKEAPFLFESNAGGSAPGSGAPRPGSKTISGGDKAAFSENLEDIASGSVEVI